MYYIVLQQMSSYEFNYTGDEVCVPCKWITFKGTMEKQ